MNSCKIDNRTFLYILFIYFVIAIWILTVTPFTPQEADVLYNNHNFLSTYLVKLISIFSKNHIVLRVPFFIISILSLYLFNKILKVYFKDSQYRYLTLLIYILTPGVFLSFVIVNYATITIFLTLLFIYAYLKDNKLIQTISLVLLLFTNTAQFALYLALILYSFRKKDWFLASVSTILFILTSLIASYPIDGIPKGHLVALFGIYGVTLSPLLFIIIIYSLYRVAIKGDKDLIWYITMTVFVISLLLSIRQKIKVIDFTPYIVIAVPIVVNIFRNSISIRLEQFRKFYIKVCISVFIVLLLETLLIVLNYPIYKYTGKQLYLIDKNIYNMHNSVEKMKQNGIKCLKSIKKRDLNLYRYYNITTCQ